MTFAAVGSLIQGSNVSSFSLTPSGTGDLILFEIMSQTSAVTGLSSSNVTWSQLGSNFTGTAAGVTLFCNIWQAKVTAASIATVTISGGNSLHLNFAGFEYSSTVGSWQLDAFGTVDAATANYPALTPSGAGRLYFGYTDNANAASAGSTSGYIYANDSNSNGLCYNVNCANSAQTPVWADSFGKTGIAVMMLEAVPPSSGVAQHSVFRGPGPRGPLRLMAPGTPQAPGFEGWGEPL